jgi:histone H3/H4
MSKRSTVKSLTLRDDDERIPLPKRTKSRKVLRNSEEAIPAAAVNRLVKKQGFENMSKKVIEPLKAYISQYVSQIAKILTTILQNANTKRDGTAKKYQRKTINIQMVEHAFSLLHWGKVYGITKDRKVAPVNRNMRNVMSADRVIPQASFSRLIREKAQDYVDELRFEGNALKYIQIGVEKQTGNDLKILKAIADAYGEKTLLYKHIGILVIINDVRYGQTIRSTPGHSITAPKRKVKRAVVDGSEVETDSESS